ELEVVERQDVLRLAIILAIAQRDRTQRRRPELAIVLEDPLLVLERVRTLLAVVALLDPDPDPALGLAVDIERLHVLGPPEAHRAGLRQRLGVVVEPELVAAARQRAARRRAAEVAPA